LLLLRLSGLMLHGLPWSVTARDAETAQHPHQIVIVLRRRCDADEDPVEQIDVGAIEQRFEALELRAVQALEARFGERAEDEVYLLRAAMPAAELQPPAADIQLLARQLAQLFVISRYLDIAEGVFFDTDIATGLHHIGLLLRCDDLTIGSGLL